MLPLLVSIAFYIVTSYAATSIRQLLGRLQFEDKVIVNMWDLSLDLASSFVTYCVALVLPLLVSIASYNFLRRAHVGVLNLSTTTAVLVTITPNIIPTGVRGVWRRRTLSRRMAGVDNPNTSD